MDFTAKMTLGADFNFAENNTQTPLNKDESKEHDIAFAFAGRTVGVICLTISIFILVGRARAACLQLPPLPVGVLHLVQTAVSCMSALSVAVCPIYPETSGTLLQGTAEFIVEWSRHLTILLLFTFHLTKMKSHHSHNLTGLQMAALVLVLVAISGVLASPVALAVYSPEGATGSGRAVFWLSIVHGLMCIITIGTGVWLIRRLIGKCMRAGSTETLEQGQREEGLSETGSRTHTPSADVIGGHVLTNHGLGIHGMQQQHNKSVLEGVTHGKVHHDPKMGSRRFSIEVTRKISQVLTAPGPSNVQPQSDGLRFSCKTIAMPEGVENGSWNGWKSQLISTITQVVLTSCLGLPLAVLVAVRSVTSTENIQMTILQLTINIVTCIYHSSLAIASFLTSLDSVTNGSFGPSTCCRPTQVQPAVTHQQITLVAEFVSSRGNSESRYSTDTEPMPSFSPTNLEDCRRKTVVARPSVPSRGGNPTPHRAHRTNESFSFQSRMSTVSYIADVSNTKFVHETGKERGLSNTLTDISGFTNNTLNQSMEKHK